jgi:hypothetical protein
LVLSAATVDVGAMINAQNVHGYCVVVDLVDHTVGSTSGCPQSSEFAL